MTARVTIQSQRGTSMSQQEPSFVGREERPLGGARTPIIPPPEAWPPTTPRRTG